MGEYWQFVCVNRRGIVVTRCNPQRAFGGMKWNEFVGSPGGKGLLMLLNDEFCPPECTWIRISDYGQVGPEADDMEWDFDGLYDQTQEMEDLALHPELRLRAVQLGLTHHQCIDMCDQITHKIHTSVSAMYEMSGEEGENPDEKSFQPPTLPLSNPLLRLERNMAFWRNISWAAGIFICMQKASAEKVWAPWGDGFLHLTETARQRGFKRCSARLAQKRPDAKRQ
jgi:hypothetical protein